MKSVKYVFTQPFRYESDLTPGQTVLRNFMTIAFLNSTSWDKKTLYLFWLHILSVSYKATDSCKQQQQAMVHFPTNTQRMFQINIII